MNCPHCGGHSSVVKARCTSCGRAVSARPSAAAAVLTPPPLSAAGLTISTDEMRTMFPGEEPTLAPGDEPTSAGGPEPTLDLKPFAGVDPTRLDDMTRPPDASRPSPSAGPLQIGQRFGDRYHIVRLLGIGGMGAVYQAWDAELEVVVALKVVRLESITDPKELAALERRFKQELLLARQVTHKNVVRIHDLGEIDGIKYITMSFIHGADLATVLQREGKLPVPVALSYMRQIASGLLAAHEAGVVHRDLKPANIMIEGDHAIIMDFGIARSAGGPQQSPAIGPPPVAMTKSRRVQAAQTMVGSVVGTITYMAPEQAQGQPVDQRADMYALGLIVADMLLGLKRRGDNFNAMEDLQRRIAERPTPLRALDQTIPEEFDRIISRLVEPNPADRFQTTAELVAALDRLDENGKPLPLIRRLTPRLMAATAAVVTLLLAGTFYITREALAPPTVHDPISVVIADFQNNTNDAAFNGVVEPTLRRALEGAGFITAYDRLRLRSTVGVRPPERLDETAAREIAVKQGLNVIVAGSIEPQGNAYNVTVKAVQAVTGNVIATSNRRASSKDDVLAAATRLAGTIRTALGDETASESDQIFAMTSLSTTSLDVVRLYVEGMEALSNNRLEDARQKFTSAIERDPKFGVVYTGLASALRNLGRPQEAEKYLNESLRYLDGMTERERFATRGYFYLTASDYQLCVKEFGELISRYSADVVGRTQRALCMSKLRDLRGAVSEMRYVVDRLPNRSIFRTNLALYANYAGDFELAKKEAEALPPGEYTSLVVALAQLGEGERRNAIATYEQLRTVSPLGASMAAAGLADVAIVEGRFADAVLLLEQGIAGDVAEKAVERAARKFATLAYLELWRGRKAAAVAAAEKALANSKTVKIRFMAAQTFIGAGEPGRARPVIDGLAAELQAEPQAHAKILEGELALTNGDPRQAIKHLTDANTLFDTWIGHFLLGRAYLEAGAFPQADSEFDRCIKRRGEALSLFLDEDPTFRYFPPVHYYQGRVREGLKNAGFTESYKTYLQFRGESKEDPLVADARKRAGGGAETTR